MNALLNNLPVRLKIMGNTGLLLGLLSIASLYAIATMSQIGGELKSITQKDIPLSMNISDITRDQKQQAIHLERALRFSGALQRNLAQLKTELGRFDDLSRQIKEEIRHSEAVAGAAKGLSEKAGREFAHVDKALKQIEHEY